MQEDRQKATQDRNKNRDGTHKQSKDSQKDSQPTHLRISQILSEPSEDGKEDEGGIRYAL